VSNIEEVIVDDRRPSGTLVNVVGWPDNDIGLFIKTFRIVASFAQTTSGWAELDRFNNEHISGCDCPYPHAWHHKVLIKGSTKLFNT